MNTAYKDKDPGKRANFGKKATCKKQDIQKSILAVKGTSIFGKILGREHYPLLPHTQKSPRLLLGE